MNVKKFVLALLLSASLTPAKSIGPFDDENLILVHASNVMSENSTKIAGSQLVNILDESSHIEPEGTNIRPRITLHHCLGGMVPKESHGVQFMGTHMPSHLHTDKDVCAYLDPLKSFSGEVYGGQIKDFITIDRHTYKENSIVIAPVHKVQEFQNKNPDYKGKLISFDPNQVSLREKIDEVIREILGALSFNEIKNKNSLSDYLNFCDEQKYSYAPHDTTTFRVLERVSSPFQQAIFKINQGKEPRLLPADQVRPTTTIIRTLAQDIYQQLESLLSEDKKQAIQAWMGEMDDWLTLFEFDADLRLHQKKSLFVNNPYIKEFIKNRADSNYLNDKAKELLESETNLNLTAESLFPEENNAKGESLKWLSHAPFPLILKLKKNLLQEGYPDHAYGLELLFLMKHFGLMDANKRSIPLKDEALLFKTLKHLKPSAQLQYHVKQELEDMLLKDESFMNEKSLSLLNSIEGRALRQRVWGDKSTLDFWTVLKVSSAANILFNDLKDDLEFGQPERRFIQIVRRWLLEQCALNARLNPGNQDIIIAESQSHSMRERLLKNPKLSLFNYGSALELSVMIDLYKMSLCEDIRHPDNLLGALISQGCFKSWGDLFRQLYDLEGLSKQDILNILKGDDTLPPQLTVFGLGSAMERHLQQKQEDLKSLEAYLPVYQELAKRVANEEERTSLFFDWDLAFLKVCVYGKVAEFGENKVTINPNWDTAKNYYDKLCQKADADEKEQLDEVMKPIFEKERMSKK